MAARSISRTTAAKSVLVDFWATWRPVHRRTAQREEVYADYHAQGFEVIGISLENAKLAPEDTPEQTAAKLEAAKKSLPISPPPTTCLGRSSSTASFRKTQFSTRYGIAAIPAMFLVDQEGKIVTTSARGPELEAEVKRLLKL